MNDIFQWDVLKNMLQIKSYDGMFQAMSAMTVKKNSQNKNLKSKLLQNKSFFSFSLKCLDLNCTPKKDTAIYIAWYYSYISKHFISVCLLLNSKR